MTGNQPTAVPAAKRVPHTWDRPTGAAQDHYAWLRDREDPDTIGYLEAENTFADSWFAPYADTVEAIYEEIRSRVQETDDSPPVRDGDWWYQRRTEEGEGDGHEAKRRPECCERAGRLHGVPSCVLTCHTIVDEPSVQARVPTPPPARV